MGPLACAPEGPNVACGCALLPLRNGAVGAWLVALGALAFARFNRPRRVK